MSTARSRFPLGYFDNQAASFQARWAEERALQKDVADLRARLRRVTGEEAPTMAAFVDYGRYVAGFQAAWDLAQKHRGNLAAAWEEASLLKSVLDALTGMAQPRTVTGLMGMFRCAEFEAFRRDVEFFQCLSAQKRAFELLPNTMAHTMTREHRLWEARRRLYTTAQEEEEAQKLLLEDGALDAGDIQAAMQALGEEDKQHE